MDNQVLFKCNPWSVVHILFLVNAILNFGELSANHLLTDFKYGILLTIYFSLAILEFLLVKSQRQSCQWK